MEDKNWENLLSLLKEHETLGLEWSPLAIYNKDGDMIEWYIDRVSYYAEYVNNLITIYRAEDDGRVIGGCIKNIAHIMNPIIPPSQRMD